MTRRFPKFLVPSPARRRVAPIFSAQTVAVPLERRQTQTLSVLDGGEIIELSVKPSLWYVLSVAWRFVAGCIALAAAVWLIAPPSVYPAGAVVIGACCAAVALRLGLAALQWATRLYVLTNRRVLRFRGVLEVDVAEVPLVSIEKIEPRVSQTQRLLGLGTIRLTRQLDARVEERCGAPRVLCWEDLAAPRCVYQRLVAAVRRARHLAGLD